MAWASVILSARAFEEGAYGLSGLSMKEDKLSFFFWCLFVVCSFICLFILLMKYKGKYSLQM